MSSKPPRRHPGTTPRNHPRSTRWAVDFDYLDQLSPKEQEWLGRFADAHYKADPSAMKGKGWNRAKRRAAYRAKNAANRDMYARDENPREVVDVVPEPGVDPADPPWTDTPAYLDSAEYKALREDFRGELAEFDGRNPEKTEEYEAARRRLMAVVLEGDTDAE